MFVNRGPYGAGIFNNEAGPPTVCSQSKPNFMKTLPMVEYCCELSWQSTKFEKF